MYKDPNQILENKIDSLFALLACQLLGKQSCVVANLISSNVEKRKFLHQSAIPTALGKGSWSLAFPKSQN